ncbi:uncharacterized protein DDB_G0271670-like [Amphibalanus amphitrite]|uniref:uncharacterized protein DDB_G0271670-like n=1 Tax=Amphibalanus amphitrite TaxID=1232801 RepID=UPI001C920B6A|nr:uncharacterized protein DDB_G0271670-like [Amphibalanus amphitrite]
MKHWTEDEERALLRIVQEKNLLGAIDGRRARNSQIFQCLSEAMGDMGYDRPAEVCRTKLKTLRLRFNSLARARARSGAGSGEDMPHQDLLQELLGGRPVATSTGSTMDLGIPQADPPLPEDNVVSFRGEAVDANTDDISTVAGDAELQQLYEDLFEAGTPQTLPASAARPTAARLPASAAPQTPPASAARPIASAARPPASAARPIAFAARPTTSAVRPPASAALPTTSTLSPTPSSTARPGPSTCVPHSASDLLQSPRSSQSDNSLPHLHDIPDDQSVSSHQSSLSPPAPRSVPESRNRTTSSSSSSTTSSTRSRHPTRLTPAQPAPPADDGLSGTERAARQRQARRRSATGYRDRVLSALEASQEEDRRAAAREEARDEREDRVLDALLEEMRAGTNLLREAVGVMRDMAAASARRAHRRRSRSRSPM